LATRQRAEIARAIAQDARYFLFDEPNSALTEEESDRLFAYIHDLARRGRIVILVTHRLAEIVAHCARVVVIRDGRVAAEFDAAHLTEEAIARELVVGTSAAPDREYGRPPMSGGVDRDQAPIGSSAITAAGEPPVLALRGWSHAAGLFRDVELNVHRGEIVAAVGVEGSGARELVASTAGYAPGAGYRAIAGAEDGRAIARGSAYLPADRRGSLFGNLSVAENLLIRLGVPEIASWGGFLDLARMRTLASQLVARFGVRTRGPGAPLGSLSGGNQQKVAIAAAIAREPRLLVVEEPTRGVDVSATSDIYGILRQFTAAGGGVLVYCTEVPEVFELADRAVVVDRGRINRMIRVADHLDVASLAAAIARSEHTLVTAEDLAASRGHNEEIAGGSPTDPNPSTPGGWA
jgi:ABC-type sugar transport system ATPase subunit